jgi:tRNA uridine 5-carbamoylmethylation protein Kti12
MKLIIIRGIPGSGKTTLAKTLSPGHYHEADQYMVNADGNYRFDPRRLSEVHQKCQEAVRRDLNAKVEIVVVSNTFTRHSEYAPYLKMAAENGYTVEVIVADGAYKNVHGVPAATVEAMRQRFEV